VKLVLVTYNEAIDVEVMDALQSCGIEHFTKWQRVLGKGEASEPHLDSNVWPGLNNVLAVVCEDNLAKKLLSSVRELRKTLSKEGIKAFLLPIEEVT